MTMNYKGAFSILLMITLFGCNNLQKEKSSEAETISETIAMQKIENSHTLCFRNEYPFENEPNEKDVEELTLTITGDKATGTYNWLPAFKDQREGTFIGTIKNETINAQFAFIQEGIEDTTSLKIILADKKVVIS